MKTITRMFCASAIAATIAAPQAQAAILDYNHAFSYTELGAEIISYGETAQVAGQALDLNAAVTNLGQRSGGYTPIGDYTGFYVQTATTLDPLLIQEDWDLPPYGLVQTNDRRVRWNEMNALYSYLFKDSPFHVVGGINISTLSFIRSNFQRSTGTAALESALGYPTGTLPGVTGAVTEDSTHFVAKAGIRYDSTFIDPDEETRFLAGFSVGIPLYYKVENSNYPGYTWSDSFKGFDVSANVGYGFAIFGKFMLSTHIELLYKKRPQTASQFIGNDSITGNPLYSAIPEVTIWNTRVSMGVEWSY